MVEEESKNKVELRSSSRRAAMPSVAASLRSRSIRSSDGKKGGGGFTDRRSSASARDEKSAEWTLSTRNTTGTGGGFFGDEELARDADAQERRSYESLETDDRYTRVPFTPTHTARTHGKRFPTPRGFFLVVFFFFATLKSFFLIRSRR